MCVQSIFHFVANDTGLADGPHAVERLYLRARDAEDDPAGGDRWPQSDDALGSSGGYSASASREGAGRGRSSIGIGQLRGYRTGGWKNTARYRDRGS